MYVEKDCNGNPISTSSPLYAFEMIFTALAPMLIQSISCNVHNKEGALKHKCYCIKITLVDIVEL